MYGISRFRIIPQYLPGAHENICMYLHTPDMRPSLTPLEIQPLNVIGNGQQTAPKIAAVCI